MNLDDFVFAANLARYRRMLDEAKDDAERETLRMLLAEEIVNAGARLAFGEKRLDLAPPQPKA